MASAFARKCYEFTFFSPPACSLEGNADCWTKKHFGLKGSKSWELSLNSLCEICAVWSLALGSWVAFCSWESGVNTLVMLESLEKNSEENSSKCVFVLSSYVSILDCEKGRLWSLDIYEQDMLYFSKGFELGDWDKKILKVGTCEKISFYKAV